jgi:transposase-like protein
MWHVTSQKYGGNALGLKRFVGFGSYQTAWTWLHKMRHAMVRPNRDRLGGKVEVDETYVGGEESGVSDRETEKKAIVAIAVEVHEPYRFGRVRLRRVPDVSGASLIPFVCDTVEPGTEVLTDGWRGYNALPEHGYVHRRTILSSSGDPAHVLMPAVHRIAALLKRWLLGTHQGAVRNKYLDYYLDEYTFRFNRRSSRARGLLFYRLVQQAVQVDHISRSQIVLGDPVVNHNMEGSRERSGYPFRNIPIIGMPGQNPSARDRTPRSSGRRSLRSSPVWVFHNSSQPFAEAKCQGAARLFQVAVRGDHGQPGIGLVEKSVAVDAHRGWRPFRCCLPGCPAIERAESGPLFNGFPVFAFQFCTAGNRFGQKPEQFQLVGADPGSLLFRQGCPGRHGEPVAASAHQDAGRVHLGERLLQIHLELLHEGLGFPPKAANIRKGGQ